MLVTPKSVPQFVLARAGGKGRNLYHLSNLGVKVPAWVVLGSNVFEQFKELTHLQDKIDKVFAQESSFNIISKKIEQLILETQIPEQTLKTFQEGYQKINSQLIAVRSSAIDEDSAGHSFAGQLSSYLYIKNKEDALDALKRCWASAYSERGLSYRQHNGLELKELSVAVIFQEMIDPDISGVVFTCHPTTGTTEKHVINSVYGVGEGLVSGLLDADTYVVDKKTGIKDEAEIVGKPKKLHQNDQGSGLQESDVEQALQEVSSLSDKQIKELSELANTIETSYRYPQDIEWAIKDGQIYILQARPVTTEIINSQGILNIWDNSNIVESYGGITAPLTFTFAKHVYHSVYVQFCEILMVPQKRIKEMDYFLRNMLGSFYGRVYYNILNWYKLTSILPGFKQNASFMETMMGTSHGLTDEIAERIRPPEFEKLLSSKIRRFVTGIKFFYFHLNIQSVVDKFMEYFYVHYEEFRNKDYSAMDSNQIYGEFQELERRLLTRWKAPIINDFLVMIHFGLLKKLTEKWLGNLGEGLQNDLLCGDGNLESAAPTKEVMKLASYVNGIEGLKKLLLIHDSQDCYEALNQSEYSEFKDMIDLYIDKYGHRCMSEMKLEQRDLHHNPATLFTFIKNHLSSGHFNIEEMEEREQKIRSEAEQKVAKNLSGLKALAYEWSLKHARKAVRNRENTRFCRTRVYGIVRRMFYAIGNDFALRGIIEQGPDLFYLTMDEMAGALEGTGTMINLKAVVEMRKIEYQRYEEFEPLPRFITRGPVYWANQHCEEEEEISQDELPENCLKGLGCCPGVIEGRVKVILTPDDNLDLNGQILVTMRTDPGWVPLFPSASGLLVERGGLLSHSAIVAREMGLPTVVGVKNLTKILKNDMLVRFNGETGLIEILEDPNEKAQQSPVN